MRRLITHFNSLFLGMILGTAFVAVACAPPSHRQERVRANGIAIGYEIVGDENHTTVLLVAGRNSQVVHLPASFCLYLANQGCHASSSVDARSASFVMPVRREQVREFRK